LLGEAEALDRVLERAPLPSLAREAALADRIISAAQRSPRIVRLEETSAPAAAAENVIRWPGARVQVAMAAVRRRPGGRLVCRSLLCGIYFGLSNVAQGALEDVAGITFGTSSGPTLAQLDPLDEDLL
jgi:hypothetical protein